MGFNRGKMEDQRRQAAEKEAAQALEHAERLIALERAPNQANADAVLTDYRRRDCRPLLVPLGSLSRLPNNQCD